MDPSPTLQPADGGKVGAQISPIIPFTGKKIVFRTLGFILSTLGSVPSNVFTVVLGTLNTFDGTDPKVDRVKPKVRNTIFFPVIVHKAFISYSCSKVLHPVTMLSSAHLDCICIQLYCIMTQSIPPLAPPLNTYPST